MNISVVMGFRGGDDVGFYHRLRNMRRAHTAAYRQFCPVEFIVEEDDKFSQLGGLFGASFTKNSEPYNRGAVFNRGFKKTTGDVICFMDTDVIVAAPFSNSVRDDVEEAIKVGDHDAVLPYNVVKYLTPESTAIIDQCRGSLSVAQLPIERHSDSAKGGIIFVTRYFFEKMGGFYEGFRGWGAEDDEFWMRIEKKCRLPYDLIHMWHPPASREFSGHNAKILRQRRLEHEK